MLQSVPADQNTGKRQKCCVYVYSFLIPDAKTTKLIQPCEGAFHNPAPASQPTTMRGVAHCKQRQDTTGTYSAPDLLGIVSPVTHQEIWATTGPAT
jgi:hypothetical protein